MNTGSILGRFGSTVQEAAEILLTHDMAQFVASDAHSVQRRTLDLPQAHGVLVELLGRSGRRSLWRPIPGRCSPAISPQASAAAIPQEAAFLLLSAVLLA